MLPNAEGEAHPHGRFEFYSLFIRASDEVPQHDGKNLSGTGLRHRKDTNNTDLICERGNWMRQHGRWQDRNAGHGKVQKHKDPIYIYL
jgi:hypothetical protein